MTVGGGAFSSYRLSLVGWLVGRQTYIETTDKAELMARQLAWYRALQPKAAMLKFDLPWPENKHDTASATEFPCGEIRFPVFATYVIPTTTIIAQGAFILLDVVVVSRYVFFLGLGPTHCTLEPHYQLAPDACALVRSPTGTECRLVTAGSKFSLNEKDAGFQKERSATQMYNHRKYVSSFIFSCCCCCC